jgi:hypothetical protein
MRVIKLVLVGHISFFFFFENRVLRRIFGPKKNEVTGEWRSLHNKELHALYSSQRASCSVLLTKSFMLCTPHWISFRWSSQED